MALKPGDAFDRYTIEAEIGEGGMGVVYRAMDTRLHRRVALKLLRVEPAAGGSEDAEARARLLREARAAAALDHANAVSIFDVGEHDGMPYIAMELVVGKPLRTFVGDASVSFEKRTRWLLDVARALAAAHERDLVHRDIKPENVMVKDDGAIKVLDFGIARRVQAVDPDATTATAGLSTLTERGVVVGTPLYMAPEQMRGEELDGRADQFSWGVLAYELLSGGLPWRKGDTLSLVAQVLTAEPVPLATAAQGVSPDVAAVVMTALAKNRNARFASMDVIVEALDRPAPPAQSPAASGGSRMRAVVGGGVLLGLFAFAGLLFLYRVGHASNAPQPTSASSTAPAASSGVVRIADLPLPRSQNAEAIRAYEDGLQALRDGGLWATRKGFERAAELDPSMGAAWLRLLRMQDASGSPSEERELYRKAVKARAALDERDAQILDAIEPRVLREPPDLAEGRARADRLTELYPRDVDVLRLAIGAEIAALDYRAAEASVDRALAMDPDSADLWARKGQVRAQLNDADGASAAWNHCLDVFAGATDCMYMSAWLATTQGSCGVVETLGRKITRAEPEGSQGYMYLANALAAQNRSRELVLEGARQEWARTPEQWRTLTVAGDMLQIDLLYGDFGSADRDVEAFDRLAESDADENSHAAVAITRLDLADEAQDVRRAGQVAKAFAARRDAWVRQRFFDEVPLIGDPLIPMVAAEARAGLVGASAVDEARAKWLDDWRGQMAQARTGYLWLHGWALPARTESEARAALAARDQFAPLPLPVKFTWYGPTYEAEAGKVLLLAGRAAEAIEPLERAARACDAYMFPVEKVRSWLWLGQAREATGDKYAACAAYQQVVARWSPASARSVTARTASDRMTALRCLPAR